MQSVMKSKDLQFMANLTPTFLSQEDHDVNVVYFSTWGVAKFLTYLFCQIHFLPKVWDQQKKIDCM